MEGSGEHITETGRVWCECSRTKAENGRERDDKPGHPSAERSV